MSLTLTHTRTSVMVVSVVQIRGTVRVLPLALSHWRKDHLKWSQETLARKATNTQRARANSVTVSPSAVAMIESGRRQPSRLVADVLAEAMDLPVGAFAVVEGVEGDDTEQVA